MKQYVKYWHFSADQSYLSYYINDLIDDGFIIISITPTEYRKRISETTFEVVEAIILVSK